MDKIIFHVDVNNAFLSWSAVDLLRKGYGRDIREIPSIIGGDESKRSGIVLSRSTIAKKYGVVAAETIRDAKKKCPNLEVFPSNYSLYEKESNKMINYLKDYTPDLEQVSVDECFMDLSNTKYLYDDILVLAYKIKNEIKEKFGFTVNVGIANNKLCAKMASDFLKPDKVHTLFDYEIKSKMWPLPIEDLLFVGKSSSKILRSININTIGDLANSDINILNKYFKSRSLELIKMANGIDNSVVSSNISKNKCISYSRTLEKDTESILELKKILLKMSDYVGIRARSDKLYAGTIAILIRYKNLDKMTHQKKLDNPTNNTMVIYKEIVSLLEHINLKEPVRSIGIRLDNLVENYNEQISIFDNKKDNNNDVQKIIDNINLKYNDNKIMPAIFFKKD